MTSFTALMPLPYSSIRNRRERKKRDQEMNLHLGVALRKDFSFFINLSSIASMLNLNECDTVACNAVPNLLCLGVSVLLNESLVGFKIIRELVWIPMEKTPRCTLDVFRSDVTQLTITASSCQFRQSLWLCL